MGYAKDMIENLPGFIEYKVNEMKLPQWIAVTMIKIH